MRLETLTNEPKIIAVVGNPNEAKSNLLYHLLEEFKKLGTFNLFTYGLRNKVDKAVEINSIEELEVIRDSIVILDEVMTLWDLDDRSAKRMIEKTLRLIFHNNNILIICLTPENVKKFIAGKIDQYFFKKCNLSEFINGSKTKSVVLGYKGNEMGSSVLNLDKNESLFYDGLHYEKINVPYLEKYDVKRKNKSIINVHKNVEKNVVQNVEEKKLEKISN